jgi:hypothetical protein
MLPPWQQVSKKVCCLQIHLSDELELPAASICKFSMGALCYHNLAQCLCEFVVGYRSVARQRPTSDNVSTVGSGVFYVVRSEDISLDWPSSVSECSWVKWSELVSELVRELRQFSRYELLLLEAGSWSTERVRETRVRGTSAVGSRYQATTGEDTADRRISTGCSELQSVWITDSPILTCSYDLSEFNKPNYQSTPRL